MYQNYQLLHDVIVLSKNIINFNEYPSFIDLNRRGLADTVLRNRRNDPFAYFFLNECKRSTFPTKRKYFPSNFLYNICRNNCVRLTYSREQSNGWPLPGQSGWQNESQLVSTVQHVKDPGSRYKYLYEALCTIV